MNGEEEKVNWEEETKEKAVKRKRRKRKRKKNKEKERLKGGLQGCANDRGLGFQAKSRNGGKGWKMEEEKSREAGRDV